MCGAQPVSLIVRVSVVTRLRLTQVYAETVRLQMLSLMHQLPANYGTVLAVLILLTARYRVRAGANGEARPPQLPVGTCNCKEFPAMLGCAHPTAGGPPAELLRLRDYLNEDLAAPFPLPSRRSPTAAVFSVFWQGARRKSRGRIG